MGRYGQSAALLPDGEVLVEGGCTSTCDSGPQVDASYLYSDGTWRQTASIPASRIYQNETVLGDGEVLLAGGYEGDGGNATASAELYIPPVVLASPDDAEPGQAITVTVNGFYAYEKVVVRLLGKVKTVLARSTTGSDGGYAVTITVPSVPAGAYELNADGLTSRATATNTFVVTSG